jgi:hypothetical protein
MNDVGETALDIAKNLRASGKNVHLDGLFHGIALELPTGDHMIYGGSHLKKIQDRIQQQTQAVDYEGMKRQLGEALQANVSHERAREHSESKLVLIRTTRDRLDLERRQAIAIRDDMQDKRDNAHSAETGMAAELESLKNVASRLDEMERAKNAVEERYVREVQMRQRAQRERDQAVEVVRRLRLERDEADSKVMGASERLKETVGVCLSVALVQSRQKTRVEGEVSDWRDKTAKKETELINLRTLNATALKQVEDAACDTRVKKRSPSSRQRDPAHVRGTRSQVVLVGDGDSPAVPITGPE